ncbi:MAG: glycoside hydrolase family 27 protein [Pseudomonadota bacterium]|nr:glycoside hydrolase family 27 protein [Pseudomonadota bacterium]
MAESTRINRRELLAAAGAMGVLATQGRASELQSAGAGRSLLAPTPPMGWNSWNSFATTITEAQAIENAEIMARQLQPFGYDIFTIDIQWYEAEASGYEYNTKPVPTLDGYSRLLPAPNRFPSSVGGAGFQPIADKVHALGLKFGVHLMRGIARLAVERNLPIVGGRWQARDVANVASVCPWNPDMYGVDMSKPGAQEYYDSVFALLASWDVDFVKMDDMARPYDANAPEIEAAHRAIQATGRPMVLSLSPGETPLLSGEHVRRHAQMWRISDDFWDEWPQLQAQFTRLENWSMYRRPGAWPDADMLPLGRLQMGKRDCRFTPDEQRTLMTLWSIARSPLIMGGDLRHLDAATLALLTNREVLAVNQASRDNQPLHLIERVRTWTARADAGEARYLAMFNIADKGTRQVDFDLSRLGLEAVKVRDLWAQRDLGTSRQRVSATLAPHACLLYSLTPA